MARAARLLYSRQNSLAGLAADPRSVHATRLRTALWRGDLDTELPLVADSGHPEQSILPFLS